MREEKGIFKKIFVLLFFDILIINLAYFLALYFRFDLDFSAVPIEYVIAFKKYAVLNTFVTIIIYSLFISVILSGITYFVLLKLLKVPELIKIRNSFLNKLKQNWY